MWITSPAGVVMPSPTPSGMEWQTWKNSTWNGPIQTVSPAWTVFSRTLLISPPRDELGFHQAARQRRGIDRGVEPLQHVGDRPGMIFVTVGDHDRHGPRSCLILQILEIGDDVIDPQHVIFGEHQPGVYDQDILTVFVDHHVLADFPESPQWDDS